MIMQMVRKRRDVFAPNLHFHGHVFPQHQQPNLSPTKTEVFFLLLLQGLYLPRIASSGRQLPSGRAITNAVLSREEVPDPDFTSMLVAFGQFLDHDLDHIPFQRASDGEGIECCDEEGGFREDLSDEEKVFCFPIEIPPGDGVIRTPRNGRKPGCINLVRSVAAPNNDCQPGPLEQV